jgi:adenine specific DNA methylase Mod
MVADLRTNLLYFGDNLGWLREQGAFPDESVDLVYLDPPFNSNRNYNVLFKESDVRESEAQIHAFEDTWSWDKEGNVQETYNQFWMTAPEKPKQMLKSMVAALGYNDVTAYLTMMAPRLVELHRVLKPTGSLYLHCDPTASHYLKMLLDSIFGPTHFVNEIVWKRTSSHNDAKQGMARMGRVHDVILLYTKTSKAHWNQQFQPYAAEHVSTSYRFTEPGTGRVYATAGPHCQQRRR